MNIAFASVSTIFIYQYFGDVPTVW